MDFASPSILTTAVAATGTDEDSGSSTQHQNLHQKRKVIRLASVWKEHDVHVAVDSATGKLIISYNTAMPLLLPFGTRVYTGATRDFIVKPPEGRSLTLRAATEAERDLWVQGISAALEDVLHLEDANAAPSAKKRQTFMQGTLLKRAFIRSDEKHEKHEKHAEKARQTRRRSSFSSQPISRDSIDGAFNFAELRKEKAGQHMPSTREWLFREVHLWQYAQQPLQGQAASADAENNSNALHTPFWLTGDGGTGKSVVSAVLLDRLRDDAVAWHFCRHDNLAQSEPADVLRSMSAMMCVRLPGFSEAMAKQPQAALDLAKTSMDLDDIFGPLLAVPLVALEPPSTPKVVVLDALDELPQGPSRNKMLRAITSYFAKLPSWLCLFITSRNETGIKRALEAKVRKTFKKASLSLSLLSYSHFAYPISFRPRSFEWTRSAMRKISIYTCGTWRVLTPTPKPLWQISSTPSSTISICPRVE